MDRPCGCGESALSSFHSDLQLAEGEQAFARPKGKQIPHYVRNDKTFLREKTNVSGNKIAPNNRFCCLSGFFFVL